MKHKEILDNRSDAYQFVDFDKQETLEEAAKRYENTFKESDGTESVDFIEGAKWQQERSYSEEDIDELISLLKQTTEYDASFKFRLKVEQFKKK